MGRPKLLLIGIVIAAFVITSGGPARQTSDVSAQSASVISAGQRPDEQQQNPAGPSANQSPRVVAQAPLVRVDTSGTLFENVVGALQKRYFDERFRSDNLPSIAAEYRDRANRAATIQEQREVIHQFLCRIPATHMGLLSKRHFQNIFQDLRGEAYPRFGFQLVEIDKKQFAFMVLEGGPAARAGLLPWDRVVSIDELKPEESNRLDWRSDDAYLTDDRDPPVRPLIANEGDQIKLKIERKKGQSINIVVRAETYSSFAAARASARVIELDRRRIGYIHFWFVHLGGVPELLKQKLDGEFSQCEALVLDLRGRGGGGGEIQKILSVLSGSPRRPIVALVDRQSRSAKEVLAYEFRRTGIARIVGEKTAGAVIPATFADVGYDTILMFPTFKLPRYTDLLELKPVEPDVAVTRAGPYSAGDDPILKAGLDEALRLIKTR